MNRVEKLMQRIAAGETILMDGATGTELERRDVPMTTDAWNSLCVKTHPDVVRELHADYINMGAEIIITNTFSSAKFVLENVGHEDKFEFLNSRAAELAVEARAQTGKTDVIVAGGVARPKFSATDRLPSKEQAAIDYERQAKLLVDSGCDILILEMMTELVYAEIIIEQCQKTGVPVWVGFSCRIEDGVPVLNRQGTLEEALELCKRYDIPVVAVMHTLTENIDACLDVIETNWQSAVCIYAHSGKFIQPNWIFNGVISPEDYAAEAQKWQSRGVNILGGCCGIGCDHIRVLEQTIKQ